MQFSGLTEEGQGISHLQLTRKTDSLKTTAAHLPL